MIPKVIHYCWFGGSPLPEDVKKCLASWKKHCPEYEIIEWNESNFDINSNCYIKEAYEAKKYAFVTEYVRLFVMYEYGGIYMDTDVELVKNLDDFLKNHAFSGFESSNSLQSAVMASEKHFKLFGDLLEYYENRHFLNDDGSYDTTTNTVTITKMCKKYGLVLNNKYQVIDGFALYPNDYFCPLENETGVLKKTENTVAIHWFAKTWVKDESIKLLKFTRLLHRIFGTERIHNIAVRLGLRKQ